MFVNTLDVDYQRIGAGEGKAAAQKVVSLNSALNFNLTTALLQVNSLMQQYAKETLNQPQFQRSRLLSADDTKYQMRIQELKVELANLIKTGKP